MQPNQSRIEATQFAQGDELSLRMSTLSQLAESAKLSIDTKVEQDRDLIALQGITLLTLEIDTIRKEKAAA